MVMISSLDPKWILKMMKTRLTREINGRTKLAVAITQFYVDAQVNVHNKSSLIKEFQANSVRMRAI